MSKMNDHLPDTQKLVKLRRMGLTYCEIGNFYGVSGSVVQNILEVAGDLSNPLLSISENHIGFWEKASTALALIRSGQRTYEALCRGLGYRSRSATYNFVEKLIALGWVTKTPGKAATLRLTPRAEHMGELIVPVRRRLNGDLEVYRPPTQAVGESGQNEVSDKRGTLC